MLTHALVAVLLLAQPEEASMLGPERRGGMLVASAQVAAGPGWSFVSLANVGVNLVGELSVGWVAPFPLALQVRGWPLALSTATPTRSSPPAFGVSFEAALDLRFFGVGLGVGAASYLESINVSPEPQTTLLLSGMLRFGARDGLNVLLRMHLQDLGSLQFSGLEASVLVPFTSSWGLLTTLRYLSALTFSGSAGVRAALSKDLFLTVEAGALRVGVRDGPSLGVGLEFRH